MPATAVGARRIGWSPSTKRFEWPALTRFVLKRRMDPDAASLADARGPELARPQLRACIRCVSRGWPGETNDASERCTAGPMIRGSGAPTVNTAQNEKGTEPTPIARRSPTDRPASRPVMLMTIAGSGQGDPEMIDHVRRSVDDARRPSLKQRGARRARRWALIAVILAILPAGASARPLVALPGR